MPPDSSGCELPKINAPSHEIDQLLKSVKIIAVVGLSPKPDRPSHSVSAYLQRVGYRVIPVNPGQKEILGEKVYASLLEIPEPVDLVDVFRAPDAVPEIVEHAIQIKAKGIWLQEGIVHNEAAAKARAAGLTVIQNKCIYKEHAVRA
jgi:predicted CoA-binding protein